MRVTYDNYGDNFLIPGDYRELLECNRLAKRGHTYPDPVAVETVKNN